MPANPKLSSEGHPGTKKTRLVVVPINCFKDLNIVSVSECVSVWACVSVSVSVHGACERLFRTFEIKRGTRYGF